MTGNIFGERLVMMSFGESHGRAIGVVIDGLPAGLRLSEEDVQKMLDLRRPSGELSTMRREEDKVEILSGVYKGRTTGAPLAMLVWNRDVDSSAYEEIEEGWVRPGHADFTAYMKYGYYNDPRGSGRFSGRVTVSFVMAGAVAMKLIKEVLGIEVLAYVKEIAGITAPELPLEQVRRRYEFEVRCPHAEAAERMREAILRAKSEGDSVGGIVECIALNVPVGLGEPLFSALDADLAKALLAIPAVKGVEFGAGFKASRLKGSENNDPFIIEGGRVKAMKNDAGGILGGISTGMPIIFRVAFKPTPSIAKPQRTVNVKEMKEGEIAIRGRHDPCIVPRAVPVVEAVTAFVLADHAIRAGLIPPVLR